MRFVENIFVEDGSKYDQFATFAQCSMDFIQSELVHCSGAVITDCGIGSADLKLLSKNLCLHGIYIDSNMDRFGDNIQISLMELLETPNRMCDIRLSKLIPREDLEWLRLYHDCVVITSDCVKIRADRRY